MAISLIRKLIRPRVTKIPELPHIRSLTGSENSNTVTENIGRVLVDRPYINDYLESIENTIKDFDSHSQDTVRPFLNQLLTGNEENIKTAYNEVLTESKSVDLLKSLNHIPKENFKKAAYNSIKMRFSGVNILYQNSYLRFENRLSKALNSLSSEHHSAFSYLLKDPDRFERLYKISQDKLAEHIISGRSTNNSVLDGIIKVYRKADQDLINEIQSAGVTIGNIDGYGSPLSIPADSIYNIGIPRFREIFQENVSNVSTRQLDGIINFLKESSEDFTYSSRFSFPVRKLEFFSPRNEINFYKEVNGLDSNYSLFSLMMSHKANIIKKSAIVSQFGIDPKKTIKKFINKVKNRQKLDKTLVKELKDIETNFNRLVDVYNGRHTVDSVFAEKLGDMVSAITTFSLSAGGVVLRNSLFDGTINRAAVTQAIYNPKYTLGGEIVETFRNFGVLASQAIGGRADKKVVNEVLDVLGFGSALDSLSHFGLLSYENIYDVRSPITKLDKGMASVANFFHGANNKLLKWTGQHTLFDFTRAKHIIKTEQLWTTMLDNVRDYDSWFQSLSSIEKRQVKYMESAYGLGKKEFDILKKVNRTEIKAKLFGRKIPHFITPDSILNSKDIASYKDLQKTAIAWQNFIYNSSHGALPIPILGASVTARSGLHSSSSWMRLLLKPMFKFADISQSQWDNAVERVALATYGDRRKGVGFDKSLVHFTKAALIYLGGFMGVMWAKDLLLGRNPTDFTKPENLTNAFLQSGFGGYPMFMTNQMFNLFNNNDQGIYSTSPLGSVFRNFENIGKVVTAKNKKDMYKGLRSVSKFTGIGTMWYMRGLIDRSLQEALLNEYDKKLYRNQR